MKKVPFLLFSLVLLVLLAPRVLAQLPPHRFFGNVTLDGSPVTQGLVRVRIGGEVVAEAAIPSGKPKIDYVVDVIQPTGQDFGGKEVLFTVVVDGKELLADQKAVWEVGGLTRVNLTLSSDRPFGPAALRGPALVQVSPLGISGRRGKTFELSVSVDPKEWGISRGEIQLLFDPEVFRVLSLNPGGLLGADPQVEVQRIEAGRATFVLARRGATSAPTPKGTLARILVKVRSTAPSPEGTLNLETLSLRDEEGGRVKIEVETPSSFRLTITGLPGDINGDGTVDFVDLSILAAAWETREGEAGYKPEADLDDNGGIGLSDIAILGANYGRKE